MKTQIIRLDPHDDLISARDKMGWGQTGRILLVWPSGYKMLNRRLDLVTLERHAAYLGAQLALISRDSDVRYYARELGIPVFRSMRDAQRSPWRTTRKTRLNRPSIRPERPIPIAEARQQLQKQQDARVPEKPLHPLLRGVLFLIGLSAVLALLAAVLPEAQVELEPRRQAQQATLELRLNPSSARTPGLVSPEQKTVIVEGRLERASTGELLVPDEPATGIVRFTNLTESPVTVPQGTIVRTFDGEARFATDRSGIVPSGPGSDADIPVTALTPGSRGNLPPGRVQAIEGALGTQLTATNPRFTTGGTNRHVPAPSEADRAAIRRELLESFRETALEEIKLELAPGSLLITDTLELGKILEETYQPGASQPSAELSLSLRAVFEAQVVPIQELEPLAESLLNAIQPPGYQPLPGSLQIEHLTMPDDRRIWKVRFRRMVQAEIIPDHAARLAQGLPLEDARNRLSSGLPLEQPASVSLNPVWWPRLPLLPFRIHVLVREAPVEPSVRSFSMEAEG